MSHAAAWNALAERFVATAAHCDFDLWAYSVTHPPASVELRSLRRAWDTNGLPSTPITRRPPCKVARNPSAPGDRHLIQVRFISRFGDGLGWEEAVEWYEAEPFTCGYECDRVARGKGLPRVRP